MDICSDYDRRLAELDCRAPSVSAGEIESFVVEEIKAIGHDPALVAATTAESRRLVQATIKRPKAERAALERQRRADDAELGRLSATIAQNGNALHLAQVQERIGQSKRRLTEIESEMATLLGEDITEKEVA